MGAGCKAGWTEYHVRFSQILGKFWANFLMHIKTYFLKFDMNLNEFLKRLRNAYLFEN